jgi:hypothetical protein
MRIIVGTNSMKKNEFSANSTLPSITDFYWDHPSVLYVWVWVCVM